MSQTIALLTPGIPTTDSKSIAADFSSRIGGKATILCFDPLSQEGRLKAKQALTNRQVNIALCLENGIDLHVLPEAKIPIIVIARRPDMLWMAVDIVASLHVRGVNASVASSWDDAVTRVQEMLSPSILAGKKVLMFGEPFNSATIPSQNLSPEYVMERTGVNIAFRSLESLKDSLCAVEDSQAQEEMERWVAGAFEMTGVTKEDILDSSKLYILLKNIVETEYLSGISIDCVRYSFSEKPLLPPPCLAFSRLRDNGIAAPCEADVCAMLTELLFEGIARKPSFMGNIGRVNIAASTIDMLHCVVPLKMAGYETDPIPYHLVDYHGSGRGVSMSINFTTGIEVTLGAFSKDLRSFSLWPGTLTETGTGFCRNMARVHIPDAKRFLHNIAGCHYIMVYGKFVSQISKALMKMNVSVVGPIVAHDNMH